MSGLFDWMTPQVGAVKVPEGDPGSLRSAANTFVSAAEGMDAAGSRVESTASAIAGGTWYGAAAMAFTGGCRAIAGDCEAAGGAFRASAAVLGRLAEELQAAQELAKNAQSQAADLNAASSRLDNAFSDAQRIESAPKPEGAPPVQSAIPGLVVQAGALNIQALGINAQAAQAEQLAIDAAAKAAMAFDEIAGMAPSVRRAAAARAAAAQEAAQRAEDDDKGFWETVATPFVWTGKQVGNVAVGLYDGVKDPLVMVYNLTPLHGGWTNEWGKLADGVSYGWHHPGEFARAVIGIDMLEERGFSYWLGNVAPSAVAAFYTGGGAAAMRGSSGASRLMKTADNVDDLGDMARFGGRGRRRAAPGVAAAGHEGLGVRRQVGRQLPVPPALPRRRRRAQGPPRLVQPRAERDRVAQVQPVRGCPGGHRHLLPRRAGQEVRAPDRGRRRPEHASPVP